MKKFIFLLLLSYSLPSFAERWFDVEVILFKYNTSVLDTGEYWPNHAGKVDMSKVINVSDAKSLARYNMEPLPKADFELTSYYDRLAKSTRYKNLMHIGWRQNDDPRDKMPKISLNSGKKVSGNKSELEGYLRLYVDHYLFVETDILLNQSVSEAVEIPYDPRTNNTAQQTEYKSFLKGFSFKQKRRMHSNEIHYLDNPLLGMIIQVRRPEQS